MLGLSECHLRINRDINWTHKQCVQLIAYDLKRERERERGAV